MFRFSSRCWWWCSQKVKFRWTSRRLRGLLLVWRRYFRFLRSVEKTWRMTNQRWRRKVRQLDAVRYFPCAVVRLHEILDVIHAVIKSVVWASCVKFGLRIRSVAEIFSPDVNKSVNDVFELDFFDTHFHSGTLAIGVYLHYLECAPIKDGGPGNKGKHVVE